MRNGLRGEVMQLKQNMLLRRIVEVSGGDPNRWVPLGLLGQQMGLPYEEALALSDRLCEAGLVHRAGGGRLEPPVGPRVHILPAGIVHVKRLDEARGPQGAAA